MPSLVAAQRLGQVVPSRTERPIPLNVRERGRSELEVAEATGELVLLVRHHVLARKHEERILEPQLGQLGDDRNARAPQDNMAHDSTERRVQRLDLERPHDVAHADIVRVEAAHSRAAERVSEFGHCPQRRDVTEVLVSRTDPAPQNDDSRPVGTRPDRASPLNLYTLGGVCQRPPETAHWWPTDPSQSERSPWWLRGPPASRSLRTRR